MAVRPVTRTVSYQWRLRELMAARGLFNASDLEPLLAERGITLSSVQVYHPGRADRHERGERHPPPRRRGRRDGRPERAAAPAGPA